MLNPVEQQLVDALSVNEIDKVKELLGKIDNFEIKNESGETLLHVAVKQCSKELVVLLIEKGADVNLVNGEGKTPLHYAAKWNDTTEIAEILISKKAKVNAIDNEGKTPLHCACEGDGNKEIVRLLIENKANINLPDKEGKTALHHAYEWENREIVGLLIENNANEEIRDNKGKVPLDCDVKKMNDGLDSIAFESVDDIYLTHEKFHEKIIHRLNKLRESERVEGHASEEIKDGDDKILSESSVAEMNDDSENISGVTDREFNERIAKLSELEGLEQDERMLYVAISQHDKSKVSELIEKGANINVQNNQGVSPLLHSIILDDVEITKLLMEKGADLKSENEKTLLNYAAEFDSLEIMKFLIEKDYSLVETRDKKGRTPLHYATELNSVNAMRLLIEKGANIEAEDTEGRTVLHCASQWGNDETIDLLVKNKANLKARDKQGKTPLHYACDNIIDNVKAVRSLLSKKKIGESIKELRKRIKNILNGKYDKEDKENVLMMKDDEGKTALHYAACFGEKIVQLLVDEGGVYFVCKKDNLSRTAYHYAAECNNLAAMKILVKYFDHAITYQDYQGNTPLHIAAENSSMEVVKFLIRKRAGINETNKNDETALHIAVRKGDEKMVKLLIDKGADVKKVSKNEETALHIAAREGHKEIAEFLIGQGININQKNKDDKTALYLAIINKGDKELAECLMDLGATIDYTESRELLLSSIQRGDIKLVKYVYELVKNKISSNHTEFLFGAVRVGNLEAVKFFNEKVDKIEGIKDDNNKTLLFIAAEFGRLEVVEFLLSVIDKKDHINVKDSSGRTLLFVAAQKGNLDVVKLLIKNEAKTDISNTNRKTPLFIAVEEGHVEVIKFLAEVVGSDGITTEDINGRTPLDLAMQRKLSRDIIELLQNGGLQRQKQSQNSKEQLDKLGEKEGDNLELEVEKDKGDRNDLQHQGQNVYDKDLEEQLHKSRLEECKKGNMTGSKKKTLVEMIISISIVAVGSIGLVVSIVNPENVMSQNNKMLIFSLSILALTLGVMIYLLNSLKCCVSGEKDVGSVTVDDRYSYTRNQLTSDLKSQQKGEGSGALKVTHIGDNNVATETVEESVSKSEPQFGDDNLKVDEEEDKSDNLLVDSDNSHNLQNEEQTKNKKNEPETKLDLQDNQPIANVQGQGK